MEKRTRYQFQPWHIKLWRQRHYILIPLTTFTIWVKSNRLPLISAWKLAKGLAQVKMNWLYDWEEIKEQLDHLIGDNDES